MKSTIELKIKYLEEITFDENKFNNGGTSVTQKADNKSTFNFLSSNLDLNDREIIKIFITPIKFKSL